MKSSILALTIFYYIIVYLVTLQVSLVVLRFQLALGLTGAIGGSMATMHVMRGIARDLGGEKLGLAVRYPGVARHCRYS